MFCSSFSWYVVLQWLKRESSLCTFKRDALYALFVFHGSQYVSTNLVIYPLILAATKNSKYVHFLSLTFFAARIKFSAIGFFLFVSFIRTKKIFPEWETKHLNVHISTTADGISTHHENKCTEVWWCTKCNKQRRKINIITSTALRCVSNRWNIKSSMQQRRKIK